MTTTTPTKLTFCDTLEHTYRFRCMFYISGGEDRACSYNIVEKYDTKNETWSFAPSMKRKRSGAGYCVCDGKIYVAG